MALCSCAAAGAWAARRSAGASRWQARCCTQRAEGSRPTGVGSARLRSATARPRGCAVSNPQELGGAYQTHACTRLQLRGQVGGCAATFPSVRAGNIVGLLSRRAPRAAHSLPQSEAFCDSLAIRLVDRPPVLQPAPHTRAVYNNQACMQLPSVFPTTCGNKCFIYTAEEHQEHALLTTASCQLLRPLPQSGRMRLEVCG